MVHKNNRLKKARKHNETKMLSRGGVGIDTTNVIVSLDSIKSANGLTWTATQDCYVYYILRSYNAEENLTAQLFIDGGMVANLSAQGQADLGESNIGGILFLKKGQTISSRKSNRVSASITAYGLKI